MSHDFTLTTKKDSLLLFSIAVYNGIMSVLSLFLRLPNYVP